MKRSNNGTQSKKKRAKNTFSLASFGHSLKPSNAVPRTHPGPSVSCPEDEWVDMQVDDEPPADSRPTRKRKWYATTDDNLRHWVANYRDEYLRVLVTREGLLGEETILLLRDIDFVPFVASRLGMAHSLTAKTYASSACGCSLDTPTTDHALTLTWGGRISWSSRRTATTPLRLTIVNVDAVAPSLTGSNFSSYGWYPATPNNPQSAITISALKLFHAVSLQGKTTRLPFFNALAKLTDNTGGTTVDTSWRFELYANGVTFVLSSAGAWATIPTRCTAETHEGELAVECLACPKAGVNLPEGWEKAPVEVRFLYCIFLAIDACFRLKRKKISSWLADPGIQDGWAYFTRSVPYGEFVETLGEQKEMSTCTGLAALDHATPNTPRGTLPLAARADGGEHARNGPGSRQDTLDDFWHYWNWNKVVGMGTTLRSRLLKARKELTWQEEGLQEFTAAQEGEAPAWKEAVDAFEAGASTDNPYQLPHAGPTLRDVELELMHVEQERERRSSAALSTSDDTLTEYLMLGLEIEGQQRQLAADLLANKNPTSKELTDFVTRRTRVSRQIKKLRLMQRIYSPGALQCLATAADPAEPVESERTLLFLPSGLSPAQAAAPLSVSGLALAEARVRDGQCSESLEAIHHGLTHQNMRSRSLVDNQQQKIDLAARTYRQARAARLALVYVAGECGWRALEKEDLRLPEDEEEAKRRKQREMKGKRKEAAQVNENGEVRGVPGMGEKTCLVSWIWYGAGNMESTVGETMHDSVRVEWSKAYALVKRWRKETRLLQEEMGAVPAHARVAGSSLG
ncbi:hypothetical protein B0H14DRAFT_3500649 [Mycena olivaceomarginata]|nr:hypothetical protein B0H14DRAFT_3500649 [Mycena olivaceomarginata]